MITKTFDCVEMKRLGALRINEELRGKSVEEQIEYWKTRHLELQQLRATLASEDRGDPLARLERLFDE